MQNKIQDFGLNPDNSIVIGSGILNALGIRESGDLDILVTNEVFEILKNSGKFELTNKWGKEILKADNLEIVNKAHTTGIDQTFDELIANTININGVRYFTLDFLYKIKNYWVENDEVPRPKDINDLKLMENYLKSKI